jgi:hypothetical protein
MREAADEIERLRDRVRFLEVLGPVAPRQQEGTLREVEDE